MVLASQRLQEKAGRNLNAVRYSYQDMPQ